VENDANKFFGNVGKCNEIIFAFNAFFHNGILRSKICVPSCEFPYLCQFYREWVGDFFALPFIKLAE